MPEVNGQSQEGGPSDEDRQAQDEARQKKEEARQKAMEAKRLAQMKREMKRRTSELNRIEKSFKKFVSKGLTVPSSCSEALAEAKSVIAAVQAAENMEAMEDADSQSLNDHFETLNECKQRLEQLSRLPQMLKRFDGQIRATERQWNRLKKGAPESAQDAVALGDRILAGIKTARIRLDEQIKTGEIEDFEAVLEDEIIGKFDDLNAAMQQIDAAKNAKRFIAQFAGRLKEGQRMIAKLKKLGKDTSALEDLLARTKALYERIKSLKSGNDEYTEAVEELADLGQEFAEATGGNEDVGGMVKPIVGGSSPRNEGSEMGGGPGPGSMAP